MLTSQGVRGEEPPMFLQRPSTGKSQDVRHILARTFRELFTRDAVAPDTVKNLSVSKGGDDPYHERYVEALQKVFDEKQKRMEEAAMLERHIMQAQARAMSADERALNRVAQSCDNYHDLGLPPGRSHFRSCIDKELLKKHNLLTPEDYSTEERVPVAPPVGPKIPSYARETMTSKQHTRSGEFYGDQSPLPPPLQHSKSDLGINSVVSEERLQMEKSTDQLALASFPGQESWKQQLSEEQREVERRDLANLQAKVNYLRNPRFVPPSAPPGGRSLIKVSKPKPKEIGIKPKKETSLIKEPSTVFIVSPPIVTFTDYKVGQVYELTLELKNVSSVIRQCQVLPTSTLFFSVGLGQFPGEHGLVAPGMSCHYAIRFAPDSLKDFDDEIQIKTQSTLPIIVPLQARREPPKLTLPSLLDVGYCLVGGTSITQLAVKNEGGTGKFCLMPSSSWPTTNFKSVVFNGNVSIPPFDIRPSVLELNKDETGIIEIVFHPPAVKSYTQELTLVCDNCNVKQFTIKGEAEKAGVELLSVERGLTDPIPGELSDATAQHMIKFDDLNPFTYTERILLIRNTTNVSQPFQWMIYKPQFDSGSKLGSASKKMDRVPDVDSVFSIHPPTGILPAGEQLEFKMTFAPPVVGQFHSALHMILNMVPPYTTETSSGRETEEGKDQTSPEDEDNLSEIVLPNEFAQFKDLTALEIQVKAQSIPLNVVLHPYAVHVPGTNLVGTTLKKMVTMANHSRSTITFQWEPYTDKYILEMEPPFGELDPGMAMDMEIGITGPEPGKIDHTLYCYVMNMDDPLHLNVQAEFKGPELAVDEPDVNFGLVRLGRTVQKVITITNMAQIITKWSIQDSPAFATSDDPMALSELTFEPSTGELKPLESRQVTITFVPTCVESVKRVLELTVEDGNECHVAVFAEVQSAQACLLSCELNIDEIYKDVPVIPTTTLLNQTLLPTAFEWGEVEGEDAGDCSIALEPKMGLMGPREEVTVKVNFSAHRVGEFADLRIPCKIEGLETPLVLSIFCDVKGMSVHYAVTEDGQLTQDPSEDVQLRYGDVMLGATPKLFLHIRNNTAITAPFTLNMETFFARPPTPPGEQKDGSQSRTLSQRRTMLGRTPNLADPLSKTASKAHADMCQAMLCQAVGSAFVPTPASGTLQPFGEEVITMTAYSDMWGDYTDSLICKVGELEDTKIPVSMKVSGCPLSFQMTAAKPDQQPVVRFGTHVAGTASTSRTMRVNNSSPYPIRVDWETYNVVEDDEKLLDLIVAFGKPFPVLDKDGKELVPEEGGKERRRAPTPVSRPPTDFIPNSADTSPLRSREGTAEAITPPGTPDGREEQTEELEQKKVVSVFCRAHEGQKSSVPYDIKPKQMVIPGKGHANIVVSFTPHPTEEVATDMECLGYALAYMSMDTERAIGEDGKVSRVQAYEAEQLRLDVTAHLKPALLTIECGEEDGMVYRTAMSSLLQEDGRLLPESLSVCSVMLSNLTLTPLTFRLLTNKPFLLVDLDPSSNAEGRNRSQKTEMHTLKPRHNLIVKVAFQTTTDLLSEISDEYLESGGDDNGLDIENGRRIEMKDNLMVEFNNSATQLVSLSATLTVPQFHLTKESLDFGTCLVGQTRELQLMIFNKTSSHSYWSVSQESKSDTCGLDTFNVEPVAGTLEAHITHVSDSKTLLKVYFTAKHAEDYEAVFTFHGVLGETPKRLYVRGQGSYDGKHEAILNI